MFVWWDGKTNPCDVDYKSQLSVGNFLNFSLKNLWNSDKYKELRKIHLNQERFNLNPYSSCSVI